MGDIYRLNIAKVQDNLRVVLFLSQIFCNKSSYWESYYQKRGEEEKRCRILSKFTRHTIRRYICIC